MENKEYNICFELGDESHDGHGHSEKFHMTSNYSAKEITDFLNPNYDNLTNNEIDIIKSLLNNELFKNIKDANIFKEYEFIEETDNETKTGIIDLMLEYQDHIDIIDYNLM